MRLDADNALDLVARYDLVCDGTDNFATRFLVADACVLARRTLVSAAVLRFEGQLSVFKPHVHEGGPCYRCLYPEPPPEGTVPTCSEAGVLGAVTGVMGTLQATEVLKEILGIGETLSGKLLIWDALATRFRTVRLRQDPHCALCSPAATIKDLSAHRDAAAPCLCRLSRSASCCCPARMTARITRSSSPPARRRWAEVVLFATNAGCHALLTDWSGLADAAAMRGCARPASRGWKSCARRRARWACG